MMDVACQITFVGMDAAEPLRLEVRAWLARLGPVMADVKSGHVLIEGVEEPRKMRTYRVRMDLPLSDGTTVSVTHEHPSNGAHEDVYVAIRNAFRAARRALEEHAKGHPPSEKLAEIAAVDPSEFGPAAIG